MLSCAAIQKLERYGYLSLKRHSTEDFVITSVKDTKRANVYALTLLETWKEAVQFICGPISRNSISHIENADLAAPNGVHQDDPSSAVLSEGALFSEPARFTDALFYAISFAVALVTQHVLEVRTFANDAKNTSALFPDAYPAALELLSTLKDVSLAIGGGHALRSNASSDDFTKAIAHLLTNVLDLMLVLLATYPQNSEKKAVKDDVVLHEQMLAQGLVLTTVAAKMLRRVQTSYPIENLYNTRPCAALLKQLASKYKQQQKDQQPNAVPKRGVMPDEGGSGQQRQQEEQLPLFELLQRYVRACTHASASSSSTCSVSAANLFSSFSIFQRLSILHGALSTLTTAASRLQMFPETICRASEEVQHWLTQLLSSTACNRATRYVVYFREDELRLMQYNVRQASEYALYTFTTTPPVDPGLVEPLLGAEVVASKSSNSAADTVMHARAALLLAQWCVSAPFFFESFCQDEAWTSFAQEQRRAALLQQSRARRGLDKMSKSKKDRRSKANDNDQGEIEDGRRSSSASSRSSDACSLNSDASNMSVNNADAASLFSFQTANDSIGGSVTSLASRVSLLSTFSKHSAVSYLSFISVLRPSTAGSVTAGRASAANVANDGEDGGLLESGERQQHESEDGNTNLPLILLEQLTLSLHRFMETFPAALLDAYGLRSISWSCIARMFAFLEASLLNKTAAKKRMNRDGTAAGLTQPLFNLAQDIRYNKGMGYECLGLLFAKVVAPLLDVGSGAPSRRQYHLEQRRGSKDNNQEAEREIKDPTPRQKTNKKEERLAGDNSSSSIDEDADSQGGARDDEATQIRSVDGDSTEEGFFASAAAASATVGSANLSPTDNAVTRRHVEQALSTCLTAYEVVAPQVVDMNLKTILRLAARTASAATSTKLQKAVDGKAEEVSASWSGVLVQFLEDITRRLGRNNELPHLVDALIGRGEAAATPATGRNSSHEYEKDVVLPEVEELLNLEALRNVFYVSCVRRALTDATGMSVDPESLVLHLTGIASEIEERFAEEHGKNESETAFREVDEEDSENRRTKTDVHTAAQMQRTLLSLEMMEAVLEGVTPTSVSASAVLEQTTQLELLLASSFMKCVKGAQQHEAATTDHRYEKQRLLRGVIIQHACTIRQCRAVTALCLQDLGSQQVQEYLVMLDGTLWQLSTGIGYLIGTLTITELQPLLEGTAFDVTSSSPSALTAAVSLLLPSLVLQRLSLARAVTAAIGTSAGPAQQLQDMVAYVWDCIKGTERADTHHRYPHEDDGDCRSLLLANQMNSEDWLSMVALGKEKHARTAMMGLLTRSFRMRVAACPRTFLCGDATSLNIAWMSCCLRCIRGTALRALVDVYVTLSAEELCSKVSSASAEASLAQQWSALIASLIGAYEVVGHNPYWPSVLAHTVRAISHVTRAWRKFDKRSGAGADAAAAGRVLFARFTEQLLRLVLCITRSEARAAEVMRKDLLSQIREVAATKAVATTQLQLSRSGMSVAYVESIKVPAITLGDIAAPAFFADADADTLTAQIAALKDLSFEEELRDLCGLLFHSSFVKHLFSLVNLAEGKSAAPGMCMSVLAFLYQVSLAAAQTAWRARVTDGNLTALRETVAVVFLNSVAHAFSEQVPFTADNDDYNSSNNAAALMAFLEAFHTEDQYLFLHIASQRTNATTATAAESGVLDEVEKYWKDIFCRCATSVVTTMMMTIPTPTVDTNTSTVTTTCDVFCELFARLLTSAQHKRHQMSKCGSYNTFATAAGNASGKCKRTRHGDAVVTASNDTQQQALNTSLKEGLNVDNELVAVIGAGRDATQFLREVLFGSSTSPTNGEVANVEQDVHALKLREQLSIFFSLDTRNATSTRTSIKDASADCWRRFTGQGAESCVCAWWLLWKLFIISSATTEKLDDVLHAQNRVKTILSALDNATKEDTVAVRLRACSSVLRVLPPNAVPPLFFDHLNDVLHRAIPDTVTGESITVVPSCVVATAVKLLLQLFRLRPRLPAWRLLPHAQRLLVWLTHPRSRLATATSALRDVTHTKNNSISASGPSLCLLGIRLCAAVAAHPLATAASIPSHSSRRLSVTASELLDNVWLFLLSLLQGNKHGLSVSTTTTVTLRKQNTTTVELQESEMIQLILLLTQKWLYSRQQQLWSRPEMLPPVLCALFTCIMRGMESSRYSPRVLNVLAGGLSAMAAHVDAATAAEADNAERENEESSDTEEVKKGEAADAISAVAKTKENVSVPSGKRQEVEKEVKKNAAFAAPTVSARLKRMALTASTVALFEVAQHYVHVFTTFSSDTDFLFTDVLRVLSQHFLPKVTRPPIAYHPAVIIGGSTQSEMTFADLAYTCVGNAESKSLLKQAALRMEEEEDGGAAGVVGLTDGSRSIFHVA